MPERTSRRRIDVAVVRPRGVPACDICLRPTPRAKRKEDGLRHCAACYKLRFGQATCSRCGLACIAAKSDDAPICRPCGAVGRTCLRCGRPAARAGRMLPEGAVCRSCAYHSAPWKPCPQCKREAPRLSVVGGQGDPVCDRCRRAVGFATCRLCRRHRRMADTADAGRFMCVPCASGVTHACPGCSEQVAGGGSARCAACSARRRGHQRVSSHRPGIGATWAADLFVEFCNSELLGPSVDGRVVTRVDQAATFFRRVARHFADLASIDEDGLRSAFGIEALRRAEKPATFLRRALALIWHPVPITVMPADPATPAAGVPALRASYARHLHSRFAGGSLAPRTIRAYGHAGDALLDIVERDHAEVPTAGHVRRLLWGRPGLRASLGSFLRWLSTERQIAVAMPHRAPRDLKKAELRLIDGVSTALSAARTGTTARRRAMLAFLTSKLLSMPIERVLALKWGDVGCGDVVCVRFGEEAVEVPSAVGALFAVERCEATRFVFEGRSHWAPLSVGAVRYHVEEAMKHAPGRSRAKSSKRRVPLSNGEHVAEL